MDGRDLAIALDFGVAAAYKAVMKPAEGTILTVSRLAAARAAAAAREDNCGGVRAGGRHSGGAGSPGRHHQPEPGAEEGRRGGRRGARASW